MPFPVCSWLGELWSGDGWRVDDDHIGVVWHFWQTGGSPDLSARLAYLVSLSSPSSLVLLWAAAVLMTSRVEREKMELVPLQRL